MNTAQTDKKRAQCDRPFPWKCSACLKKEVYPANVPYTSEIKYDGVLHTVELPEVEIPICKSCGAMYSSYSADDQIMAALRRQLHLLTPTQIREQRKQLALKQIELAERLGVAEATISRWETGALIQSRAMDNFLRLYFALPTARAVLLGKQQDPLLGVTGEGLPNDVPVFGGHRE